MGICINVLAPPWGICNSFFFSKTNARQMPGGVGGGGGVGRRARLELTEP